MIFNLAWVVLASFQPPLPEAPTPDTRKTVVLVHGIWDSGISMFYLRKQIERAGYRCVAPSLTPNDARLGLADLSAKLQNAIEESIPRSERFSVVAFSMGGLVSRHYLQERGGAKRCEKFITISTPHNGTWTAYCYPGQGSREMRPRSEFLGRLKEQAKSLENLPCYSYRTPLDLIILPPRSSHWEQAVNRVKFSLAHPLMLIDKGVASSVVADLNGE